jgi:hypothetical protein
MTGKFAGLKGLRCDPPRGLNFVVLVGRAKGELITYNLVYDHWRRRVSIGFWTQSALVR